MVNPTRKRSNISLIAALLVVFALTACGAAATPSATRPAAAHTTIPTRPAIDQPLSPTETTAAPTSEVAVPAGPVSFSRDLLPIFNETCIKCHGGDKTEKGLNMKSYSALLAGSERGAVVIPGDANGSRLAQLVMNGKMPKRGPKLSSEQVQLIVDWINAGAQNN